MIEAEASRALAEMRTMVRVLRHGEPAELAPGPRSPTSSGWPRRAAAGPDVEVELSATSTTVRRPVGTAVYRLAQESVTNARRHARHATRIEVRVAADDDVGAPDGSATTASASAGRRPGRPGSAWSA